MIDRIQAPNLKFPTSKPFLSPQLQPTAFQSYPGGFTQNDRITKSPWSIVNFNRGISGYSRSGKGSRKAGTKIEVEANQRRRRRKYNECFKNRNCS